MVLILTIPSPYIEFADVSRIHDGPVLGEQVSAPEIAALGYPSGQQDSGKRAAVTYPVDSPDPKQRFLPLWSAAYQTLQFPLLFLHGESGWSEGHSKERPHTNLKQGTVRMILTSFFLPTVANAFCQSRSSKLIVV